MPLETTDPGSIAQKSPDATLAAAQHADKDAGDVNGVCCIRDIQLHAEVQSMKGALEILIAVSNVLVLGQQPPSLTVVRRICFLWFAMTHVVNPL